MRNDTYGITRRIVDKFVLASKLFTQTKNPLSYILDYLKMKNGPFVIVLKNGIKLLLRPKTTDRMILNDIIFRNIYLKNLTLEKDSVIVDIGAHIGIFSILCAKIASNGKIFSFEPEKENFSYLLKNIKLNNLKNVYPFRLAIGNKNGYRNLYVCKEDNLGKHSFYFDFYASKKEKVRCIDIKNMLKLIGEKIDLLKIDCEGCEYEIFSNLNSEFFYKIRNIVVEIHKIAEVENKVDIKTICEKNGYITLEEEISETEKILHAYSLNSASNMRTNKKLLP